VPPQKQSFPEKILQRRGVSPAGGVTLHAGYSRCSRAATTSVLALHQRRGDDEIGGSAVAGDGDVPHYRDAQQRLHIGVVRLRLQRVPEEDEKINLPLRNLRADLLVAAKRPALQLDNGQTQRFFQDAPRRAGSVQDMLCQQFTVESRPFQQVCLLMVMRHQRDAFLRRHRYRWLGCGWVHQRISHCSIRLMVPTQIILFRATLWKGFLQGGGAG
jgi:hypothetical protein